MKNLTALEELRLGGFNSLPEWIVEFISLKKITILDSPNITYLPHRIRNLTTLKKIRIKGCPILIDRCRREDACKIAHIPRVKLVDNWSKIDTTTTVTPTSTKIMDFH
uniref:Uncharacterized protein n=1 Tax=Oryza meridionalis TaxID=40149 RepID=A0A0E0F5A7_9ORYZ